MKEEDPDNDLVQWVKETPQVNPPAGFTQRVMEKLPELKESIWKKIKWSLLKPMKEQVYSKRAQTNEISTEPESSFYFFVTGFFYLLMGMILAAGFKAMNFHLAEANWAAAQLLLTVGTAIWLLAIGFVLMRDDRMSIKMAKFGTAFYVIFSVVNGILLRSFFNFPYADFFIIGFIGGGVCMGCMLVLAIKKMELRLQ